MMSGADQWVARGMSVSVSSRFACETVEAAAPLADQLFSVAIEWATVRKGKTLTAAQAREVLCDFPGSPCPIFAQPRKLLSLLSAQQSVGRPAYHVAAIGTSAVQDQLVRWLVRQRGWRATVLLESSEQQPSVPALLREHNVTLTRDSLAAVHLPVDLLLLQRLPASVSTVGRLQRATLAALQPSLVLLNSEEAISRAAWLGGEQAAWLTANGWGSAFVPHSPAEAAAAAAIGKQQGRRKGGKKATLEVAVAATPHRQLLLWRAGGCERPTWDLRRPIRGGVPPTEAAAVRAAWARGYTHTEWFGCAVLEPLHAMAQVLFTAPRRKGKSVWGGCFRPNSPCYWFSGSHRDGEGFVEQVLSSPDVLLSRLSAHREDAAPEQPPPLLLDPAAGEANYTGHLPDGMGAMPVLRLVSEWGWQARLSEPVPQTYAWLQANLVTAGARGAPPRVRLAPTGVTAEATPLQTTMWALSASVPELSAAGVPGGLPRVSRQRLQYLTSQDKEVPERASNDLWQINHLAGGPIAEALRAAGHTKQADAFDACKAASATRKQRCYEVAIHPHAVTLVPWRQLLREMGLEDEGRKKGAVHLDLLVLDVWDGGVAALLRAFPFDDVRPTLIYYRNPYAHRECKALRQLLLSRGYSTSAHWETSAWGELNLAWRSDRCHASGMPGAVPWHVEGLGGGGEDS